MPFCPKCGFEYAEEITACAVCDSQLVARRSGPPTQVNFDEPLVVAYEAPDQWHSSLAQLAMQDAVVPYFEQRDRLPALDGLDLSTVGRYSRLLTLQSHAERARLVIEDYLRVMERGDLALPDEPPMKSDDGGRSSKF